MKLLQTTGQHIAAATSSVMYANTKSCLKARVATLGMFFGTMFVVSTMNMADALAGTNNLIQYSQKVSTNTNVVLDIINYVSYIGGAGMGALGVVSLKKHVENPQTPMKDGLAKLGFGGVLLAFPTIVSVAQGTMRDTAGATLVDTNATAIRVR